MSRDLSIVIPTHNRKETLIKALHSYTRQTASDRIQEALVIDDGSTDGTAEAILQGGFAKQLPLRHIWQECQGQAAARNRGIQESRGEIILFTDDDIIPSSTLVSEHLSWHERYKAVSDAVVGYVAWSPELKPTPFMEWLAQDGVFTNYKHWHSGQLSKPVFLSGNISLKREFLLKNGMFDTEFRNYGLEDIELGLRLAKRGMRIFYNPGAAGFHYRRMSLADVWRRTELVESARPLFLSKVGEVPAPSPIPSGGAVRALLRRARRGTLHLTSPALRLFDTQIPLPWAVYRYYYVFYILPTVKTRLRTPA